MVNAHMEMWRSNRFLFTLESSPMPTFEPFLKGKQPSARELNRATLWGRASQFFRDALGGTRSGPYGLLSFMSGRPFMAELTSAPGSGSGATCAGSGNATEIQSGSGAGNCTQGYGFRQIVPADCGEWGVYEGGYSGNGCDLPAYELNGRDVAIVTNGNPTRVRMYWGGPNWLWFDAGSAAGGSGNGVIIPVVTCVSLDVTAP